MKKLLALLAVGALTLYGCSSGGGRVAVQDAWARPNTAGNNAAVYLSIMNGGSSEDVLLGASTELARAVEIHESMMAGDSAGDDGGMAMGGDVMQMMPVDNLALAAGESVTFEPGGYHVMLVELQQDLVLGDTFEIRLHFQQAGDVAVQVEVADR